MTSLVAAQGRDTLFNLSARKRHKSQPPGTRIYTVESGDTIPKIAVKFDLKPSLLTSLNKLPSGLPFIHPGQELFIPVGTLQQAENINIADLNAFKNDDMFTSSHSSNSNLTNSNSLSSTNSSTSERVEITPTPSCHTPSCMRFLIHSKLVTEDQGVIDGTLILTPNKLMFQPHVSDPVVLESDPDNYSLTVNMQDLVSLAIYKDLITVETEQRIRNGSYIQPPEVYRPAEEHNPDSSPPVIFEIVDESDEKFDIEATNYTSLFSENSSGCGELTNQKSGNSSCCNGLTNHVPENSFNCEEKANHMPEISPGCTQYGQNDNDGTCHTTEGHNDNKDRLILTRERSSNLTICKEKSPTKSRLSSYTSMNGVDVYINYNCGIFRQPNSASFGNSYKEITSKLPNVKLEAGVTRDDMPSLFRSISEILPSKLACDSHHHEDTGYPYYLQVLVNMTKQQDQSANTERKEVEHKIEYLECWMTIPHDKVDDLYEFFTSHYPDIYGELNFRQLSVTPRRFVALNKMSSPLLSVSSSPCVDYLQHRIDKEWEIVSIDEIMRRRSFLDIEKYLPLPQLSNCSKILNESIIKELVGCLPARCEGFPWTQVFSTEVNGYTLSTLYRQMNDIDSPVLMMVKDTEDNVFGSYLSDPLIHREHFHGTGECFLFSCTREFEVYSWTGLDNFHISTFSDSLVIGGSRTGCAGLWLDADLYHGRSQKCDTYNNEPLTGGSEDFIVQEVEVWAFMEPEECTMASSMEI